MEASFMKDFSCCGLHIPTLQDVYQHYEERHCGAATGAPTNEETSPPKRNPGEDPPPDPPAAQAIAVASDNQARRNDRQKPAPLKAEGTRPVPTDSSPATPRQIQPADNVMRGFAPSQPSAAPSASTQDDDGLSDMEMGDEFVPYSNGLPQTQFPNQDQSRIMHQSQFGRPSSSRVPPLNLNTGNMAHPVQPQFQGLRQSQPTTPVTAGRGVGMYQNNPTVSSVNTPTLTTYTTGTHPLHQQQYYTPEQFYTPDSSAPGTPGEVDPSFLDGMQAMSVDNGSFMPNTYGIYPFDNKGGALDGYINDPAKNLLSAGGMFGPSQRRQQQEETAIQLGDAQYSEDSDIAVTIRSVQKAHGVPDPSADGIPKPFHCPVIGCEKAYKNHNGLKYHKLVRMIFVFPKMNTNL